MSESVETAAYDRISIPANVHSFYLLFVSSIPLALFSAVGSGGSRQLALEPTRIVPFVVELLMVACGHPPGIGELRLNHSADGFERTFRNPVQCKLAHLQSTLRSLYVEQLDVFAVTRRWRILKRIPCCFSQQNWATVEHQNCGKLLDATDFGGTSC